MTNDKDMKRFIILFLLIPLNLPVWQAGLKLVPHIIRFSIAIKNIISGRVIATMLPFYITFMCGTNCFAQSSNFITYGIEEGLIQSQVQALTQDNQGNLWIGTIGGLTKYNGKSFTSYTQKDGLAEDWITASYKDKNGNIWFGHWAGGVSIYIPATTRPVSDGSQGDIAYIYEDEKLLDLQYETYSNYKFITAIIEDNEGNIWFGTKGAGIIKYDPTSLTTKVIDQGLSSNNISTLCVNNDGKLWIGTDKGITIYDPQKEKTLHILNTENGLISDNIQCMITALKNEIWVGTEDAGIIRFYISESFSYDNLKANNGDIIQNIRIKDGLTSDNINTIYQDNELNIWIGTKDHGVNQFISTSFSENYQLLAPGRINIFSNKFELKHYHANVFSQDREGNIWIGSENGLNKYMGALFKMYNQNDNLIDNLVWSVLADSKGNLWFGTAKGVSKFSFPAIPGNQDKKRYNDPIVENYTVENGLSENIVISIFEDMQGNIWFGSENKGVCVLLKNTGTIKKYSTTDGLADDNIFAINADNDGNIWFGTRKGVSKLNLKNSSFTNYTTKDGLGGDKVYSIFKDRKGHLWFAILGGDLTRYDGNSFRTYGKDEGVNNKFIMSITENKQDKEYNLWFAAYDAGLFKYDGENFVNISSKDGLSSNSPHFIISDDNDNIWIGMNLGIEKYDQRTKKFTLYGKQQGFLGLETNPNAVSKDEDGNIWFGTIKGGVKFDPKKDKPNRVESLTFTKGLNIYLKNAPFPEDGKFTHKQNYLTFHNIGVSLTNPIEVRYKYKLEGFDEEWSPPTKDSKKTYSNLPPGEYTFMVKSSNNNGVWNTKASTYHFIITPPFWQTLLFKILSVLFVIAAIIGFIKIREKNLIKEKKVLEEKVADRTKELAKKNKDIMGSIRYGKRIQQAIFPVQEKLKEIMSESFILLKPKELVSGDFYWFTKNNDIAVIAAVDCTGHGVPGAFMSLIGNDLLNDIVNDKGITDPAEILKAMHKGVVAALKKDEQDSETVDGMDMALCSINLKSNVLDFAGAGRPLMLIRNGNVELTKGGKYPIGLVIDAAHQSSKDTWEERKYETQKIELKKEDVIYIFTDGYCDQFGGEKHEKYSTDRFSKLLLEIQSQKMDEQGKILDETIEKWKGNQAQVDDMLIIGIKI